MEKIYQEEFTEKVLSAQVPVAVDFYADWCGPCKMLAPVMEQIAESNDDMEFFKVNVDENPELAQAYNVASIPFVGLFKNGELVDTSLGFVGADEMQAFIDRNK